MQRPRRRARHHGSRAIAIQNTHTQAISPRAWHAACHMLLLRPLIFGLGEGTPCTSSASSSLRTCSHAESTSFRSFCSSRRAAGLGSAPPPPPSASAAAALAALDNFLDKKLKIYADKRNDPNIDAVSSMSQYLNHGHLSAQRMAPHSGLWVASMEAKRTTC